MCLQVICMYKQNLALNDLNDWYTIKPNFKLYSRKKLYYIFKNPNFYSILKTLGVFDNTMWYTTVKERARLELVMLMIWLEWMGASLILFTKWSEFLTYDEDLPVSGLMNSTMKRLNGWHAEPRLLTTGLNGIPSLWIFGMPYMCGTLL